VSIHIQPIDNHPIIQQYKTKVANNALLNKAKKKQKANLSVT
jgi:hypothetical protein